MMNPAVLIRTALQPRVSGVGVEGEVDLGRGPLELETADVLHEIRRQLPRVDQLHESTPGVDGADHGLCLQLGPVLEHYPGGPAVLRDDVVDRRLESDLDSKRLGGPGQDLGEPAVATLVESPGAIGAVVLAERVIEEDESGALGTRPDLGADDAR